MTTIRVRLPNSVHDRLRQLASREGVSMNRLVATAVAEKVSAIEAEEYLAERAARGGGPRSRPRWGGSLT